MRATFPTALAAVAGPCFTALGLLALAALAPACGRTGLLDLSDGGADLRPPDVGNEMPVQPDAARDPAVEPPAPDAALMCMPTPELCNGVDDDCNGLVDDGIVPVPCPGGGSRYCVAGKMSECPKRCEACLPGGTRVCLTSYCTYWGVQTCAADGRAFGYCREETVPKECAGVAEDKKRSPELEQCCLDKGYCCLDEFDLDGDGDRTEMLGRCESVRCGS